MNEKEKPTLKSWNVRRKQLRLFESHFTLGDWRKYKNNNDLKELVIPYCYSV